MQCPNCKQFCPPDGAFCPNCGMQLNAPVVNAPASNNQMSGDPMFNNQMPNAPAGNAYAQQPVGATTAGAGVNMDFSDNSATPASNKMYTYKVLSQKDKWFSGKFDPTLLEQAINSYAQQGWRVIGCATADIPGFGATRQEFITLLEREV